MVDLGSVLEQRRCGRGNRRVPPRNRGIVQAATGLEAYDPQVEQAMTSDAWTVQQAVSVFDQVAESFDKRGIRRG